MSLRQPREPFGPLRRSWKSQRPLTRVLARVTAAFTLALIPAFVVTGACTGWYDAAELLIGTASPGALDAGAPGLVLALLGYLGLPLLTGLLVTAAVDQASASRKRRHNELVARLEKLEQGGGDDPPAR